MNAQIVCRLRGGTKLTFNVAENDAVLGREPGLAVAVPADGVSRQHAKITWDGVGYWIEDLKSTNGTFVNGVDVAREGKERLRHLDVVTLGRAVDLLFLVRDAPTGTITRTGILKAQLVPEDGESVPYEIGMGEVTMGRSTASNIVLDSSAVSKLHAKILRTSDSLVLQDLGSSNGTFVNGVRVMTALLGGGDRLSLGNVVSYRVQVTVGEITSLPDVRGTSAKQAAPAGEFSVEWKTRYEWDSGEYASLEALRRKIAEGEKQVNTKTSPLKALPTAEPVPAAKLPPTGPVKPAKPAAPPPAPKPAPPPAAAPKAPAAPLPPADGPATIASMKAMPPPKPAPAAPARSIEKLRLKGPETDLTVSDPGSYEIGRLSGAPLRVVHPTVSRRQAVLTLSADRASARVEALAGASPTLVNGKVVGEAPVELADGDKLQLGEVQLAVGLQLASPR
jgi:pSer/pThr/pTyr-binding forkhead associated (FHA) protein